MRKKYLIPAVLMSFLLMLPIGSSAQEVESLETKIVKVLAEIPADDLGKSERLMDQIIALGPEAMDALIERLVPAGEGNDVQVRYLLNSLSAYVAKGSGEQARQDLENALLKGFTFIRDPEQRRYLIERLRICGSEQSLKELEQYLDEADIYQDVLMLFVLLNTDYAMATVLSKTKEKEGRERLFFIEALGTMQVSEAEELLIGLSDGPDRETIHYSLIALSEIAGEESFKTLQKRAQLAKYQPDDKEAIHALINYGYRLQEKGQKEAAQKVGKNLLKNCTQANQSHFRTAGLMLLASQDKAAYAKLLTKEISNPNFDYRASVIAQMSIHTESKDLDQWLKLYKDLDSEVQAQMISGFGPNGAAPLFDGMIRPALKSSSPSLQAEGVKALYYQDKSKAISEVIGLLQAQQAAEVNAEVEALLKRICAREDQAVLVSGLEGSTTEGKKILIRVLAEKQATESYEAVIALRDMDKGGMNKEIYAALGGIARQSHLNVLLPMLDELSDQDEVEALQSSLLSIMDQGLQEDQKQMTIAQSKSANHKERYLPLLVKVNNAAALDRLEEVIESGTDQEVSSALSTLGKWESEESIEVLFDHLKTAAKGENQAIAFSSCRDQILGSSHPDDQKLLLIKRLEEFSASDEQQASLIRGASSIKTFLSLIYVSEYIDEPTFERTASSAAIRIALPNPTQKGLSGEIVRKIVEQSIDNLSGQDSQYLKIDVREFLDAMPADKGYASIFNGKDLSGWKGLVEDPYKRNGFSQAKMQALQKKADEQMAKDWVVKEGLLTFVGEGFKNICTIKHYRDFEMLVEWRIGPGGDSGVYLRGTPQVQIWDTALVEVGAEVGSGGLYNNEKNQSKPTQVADNPVGQWNTFRIKLTGDKVTVHLNGILVVDQVTMENYWDRSQTLIGSESIELQAHGEDVVFRNVFVRELESKDAQDQPAE